MQTVPTPSSVRRIFRSWLSKNNLTLQNVSNGMDNKPTATVGIDPSITNKNEPLPLRRLLIPRVLIAALNYACLALVDISTRAIQPVFFSTPIELGGLGLPPHHIGKILAVYGIINGFLQIFYFAKMHARFGTKNVYIAGIASSLLVFISFPVINHLARTVGAQHWLVWLAVAFHVITSIFINFSYGMWHLRTSHLVLECSSLPVLYRLRIHLHYGVVTQPSIARLCEWSGAVQCLNRPCRWPCSCELSLFFVH